MRYLNRVKKFPYFMLKQLFYNLSYPKPLSNKKDLGAIFPQKKKKFISLVKKRLLKDYFKHNFMSTTISPNFYTSIFVK